MLDTAHLFVNILLAVGYTAGTFGTIYVAVWLLVKLLGKD